MKCKKCGFELNPNGKNSGKCGAEIPSDKPPRSPRNVVAILAVAVIAIAVVPGGLFPELILSRGDGANLSGIDNSADTIPTLASQGSEITLSTTELDKIQKMLYSGCYFIHINFDTNEDVPYDVLFSPLDDVATDVYLSPSGLSKSDAEKIMSEFWGREIKNVENQIPQWMTWMSYQENGYAAFRHSIYNYEEISIEHTYDLRNGYYKVTWTIRDYLVDWNTDTSSLRATYPMTAIFKKNTASRFGYSLVAREYTHNKNHPQRITQEYVIGEWYDYNGVSTQIGTSVTDGGQSAHRIIFNDDNTIEGFAYRFYDYGTYQFINDSTIIATFDDNYFNYPSDGWVKRENYTYTMTFSYDSSTGMIVAIANGMEDHDASGSFIKSDFSLIQLDNHGGGPRDL
ncbi:hypothetical protein AGMMS49983_21160 [Clostridia bacterium]|nr:hypothetical protein AGMMS49983_21160 [Clostridia bacterium]